MKNPWFSSAPCLPEGPGENLIEVKYSIKAKQKIILKESAVLTLISECHTKDSSKNLAQKNTLE